MSQWRPPQFKAGDAVFWRVSGHGKTAKWKRATVSQFARYGADGTPHYAIYVASTKAVHFAVPEADLALADVDALTKVDR